ncbi:MAG: PEP-CTERM sorting domain-containing protein [Accumulibacter sp.]
MIFIPQYDNDHGQIIANAVDGHAYLISAVPEPNFAVYEPETYALMVAGLGLIGVIDRRKKQAA